MEYLHFQNAVSKPRLDRYLQAVNNDTNRAVSLYRVNLRLSYKLFSILGLLEVALRNSVDYHYKQAFGHDWLISQVQPGGFFWQKGCETSRNNLWKTLNTLKVTPSNDMLVASMNFGFWRYLFNSKEFAAGGSSLLQIFPNRSIGQNHTFFFNALSDLNKLRNRIAHHDPICFISSAVPVPSAWHAKAMYELAVNLFVWLAIKPEIILAEIDSVQEELVKLDKICSP